MDSHAIVRDDKKETTPKVQTTEAKINTWDYIKLKDFCGSKDTVESKRKPMKWEKKMQIVYLIIWGRALSNPACCCCCCC